MNIRTRLICVAALLCAFLTTDMEARTASAYATDLCWSGRYTETGEIPCTCWKLVSPAGQVLKRGCHKEPGYVWCHRDSDCPNGMNPESVQPSIPMTPIPASNWFFAW